MKKLLLIAGLLSLNLSISAQTPNKFNYQAAVRTSTGTLVANGANIAFRVSILDGSTSGSVLYSERIAHTINNTYGIANLEIGTGSLISGAWPTAAQWGSGSKFLKIDIDLNGASTYVDVSNTQLLSVPYAQFANNSATAATIAGTATISPSQILPAGATVGQVLKWNGTAWIAAKDSSNLGKITAVTAGTGLLGGGTSGNVSVSADNATALWNANKLQGNPIDATAPAVGQVIMWNGTAWIPKDETVNAAGTGLSITGGVINSTWTTTTTNIANNNTGNVGIGTGSTVPTASLSVAEKFKVVGADGSVVFTDAAGSIQLANPSATKNIGIYMFTSGTANLDRYIFAHSPSFPTYGLMYSDSFDRFEFQSVSKASTAFTVDLKGQRAAVGRRNPTDKFEVYDANASTRSSITSLNTAGYANMRLNTTISSLLDVTKYGVGATANLYGVNTKRLGLIANDSGSMYLHSSDSIIFGTNGSRAMTINKKGFVGIGTNTPQSLLHIKGNYANSFSELASIDFPNNNYIALYNKNKYMGYIGNWTDTMGLDIGTSGLGTKVHLVTNATPKLTVSGNNVGIGTTSPTANLDVDGSLRFRGNTPGINKVLTSTNSSGDATWTASNALPGSIAGANFIGAYIGNTYPTLSSGAYEFLHSGTPKTVTLNGNQRIMITVSCALGRITAGTFYGIIDAGYQSTATGSSVINCAGGIYMDPILTYVAGERKILTYTGSAKPAAGTYRIGAVIANLSSGQIGFFNSSDYFNLTYIIINE